MFGVGLIVGCVGTIALVITLVKIGMKMFKSKMPKKPL